MPDVVVVDASRQLKTLDDTEVDIAVHMSHSQAKVVCHTPSKIQSTFLRYRVLCVNEHTFDSVVCFTFYVE